MGTNWSGQLYNGVNGALLYYRSLDGGVTWDITNMQLLEMDSLNFIGFGGDNYAIAAKGETIALAYFNGWADSFILKSTDNGDTLTNINLKEMLNFHLKNKSHATMAVKVMINSNPYGGVKSKGLIVESFEEKPVDKTYINAGVYIVKIYNSCHYHKN